MIVALNKSMQVSVEFGTDHVPNNGVFAVTKYITHIKDNMHIAL